MKKKLSLPQYSQDINALIQHRLKDYFILSQHTDTPVHKKLTHPGMCVLYCDSVVQYSLNTLKKVHSKNSVYRSSFRQIEYSIFNSNQPPDLLVFLPKIKSCIENGGIWLVNAQDSEPLCIVSFNLFLQQFMDFQSERADHPEAEPPKLFGISAHPDLSIIFLYSDPNKIDPSTARRTRKNGIFLLKSSIKTPILDESETLDPQAPIPILTPENWQDGLTKVSLDEHGQSKIIDICSMQNFLDHPRYWNPNNDQSKIIPSNINVVYIPGTTKGKHSLAYFSKDFLNHISERFDYHVLSTPKDINSVLHPIRIGADRSVRGLSNEELAKFNRGVLLLFTPSKDALARLMIQFQTVLVTANIYSQISNIFTKAYIPIIYTPFKAPSLQNNLNLIQQNQCPVTFVADLSTTDLTSTHVYVNASTLGPRALFNIKGTSKTAESTAKLEVTETELGTLIQDTTTHIVIEDSSGELARIYHIDSNMFQYYDSNIPVKASLIIISPTDPLGLSLEPKNKTEKHVTTSPLTPSKIKLTLENKAIIQKKLNSHGSLVVIGPPATSKSWMAQQLRSDYDVVINITLWPDLSTTTMRRLLTPAFEKASKNQRVLVVFDEITCVEKDISLLMQGLLSEQITSKPDKKIVPRYFIDINGKLRHWDRHLIHFFFIGNDLETVPTVLPQPTILTQCPSLLTSELTHEEITTILRTAILPKCQNNGIDNAPLETFIPQILAIKNGLKTIHPGQYESIRGCIHALVTRSVLNKTTSMPKHHQDIWALFLVYQSHFESLGEFLLVQNTLYPESSQVTTHDLFYQFSVTINAITLDTNAIKAEYKRRNLAFDSESIINQMLRIVFLASVHEDHSGLALTHHLCVGNVELGKDLAWEIIFSLLKLSYKAIITGLGISPVRDALHPTKTPNTTPYVNVQEVNVLGPQRTLSLLDAATSNALLTMNSGGRFPVSVPLIDRVVELRNRPSGLPFIVHLIELYYQNKYKEALPRKLQITLAICYFNLSRNTPSNVSISDLLNMLEHYHDASNLPEYRRIQLATNLAFAGKVPGTLKLLLNELRNTGSIQFPLLNIQMVSWASWHPQTLATLCRILGMSSIGFTMGVPFKKTIFEKNLTPPVVSLAPELSAKHAFSTLLFFSKIVDIDPNLPKDMSESEWSLYCEILLLMVPVWKYEGKSLPIDTAYVQKTWHPIPQNSNAYFLLMALKLTLSSAFVDTNDSIEKLVTTCHDAIKPLVLPNNQLDTLSISSLGILIVAREIVRCVRSDNPTPEIMLQGVAFCQNLPLVSSKIGPLERVKDLVVTYFISQGIDLQMKKPSPSLGVVMTTEKTYNVSTAHHPATTLRDWLMQPGTYPKLVQGDGEFYQMTHHTHAFNSGGGKSKINVTPNLMTREAGVSFGRHELTALVLEKLRESTILSRGHLTDDIGPNTIHQQMGSRIRKSRHDKTSATILLNTISSQIHRIIGLPDTMIPVSLDASPSTPELVLKIAPGSAKRYVLTVNECISHTAFVPIPTLGILVSQGRSKSDPFQWNAVVYLGEVEIEYKDPRNCQQLAHYQSNLVRLLCKNIQNLHKYIPELKHLGVSDSSIQAEDGSNSLVSVDEEAFKAYFSKQMTFLNPKNPHHISALKQYNQYLRTMMQLDISTQYNFTQFQTEILCSFIRFTQMILTSKLITWEIFDIFSEIIFNLNYPTARLNCLKPAPSAPNFVYSTSTIILKESGPKVIEFTDLFQSTTSPQIATTKTTFNDEVPTSSIIELSRREAAQPSLNPPQIAFWLDILCHFSGAFAKRFVTHLPSCILTQKSEICSFYSDEDGSILDPVAVGLSGHLFQSVSQGVNQRPIDTLTIILRKQSKFPIFFDKENNVIFDFLEFVYILIELGITVQVWSPGELKVLHLPDICRTFQETAYPEFIESNKRFSDYLNSSEGKLLSYDQVENLTPVSYEYFSNIKSPARLKNYAIAMATKAILDRLPDKSPTQAEINHLIQTGNNSGNSAVLTEESFMAFIQSHVSLPIFEDKQPTYMVYGRTDGGLFNLNTLVGKHDR